MEEMRKLSGAGVDATRKIVAKSRSA